MAEPIRVDPVTRRTVLKGIVGAAGLVSIPAIILQPRQLDRRRAARTSARVRRRQRGGSGPV